MSRIESLATNALRSQIETVRTQRRGQLGSLLVSPPWGGTLAKFGLLVQLVRERPRASLGHVPMMSKPACVKVHLLSRWRSAALAGDVFCCREHKQLWFGSGVLRRNLESMSDVGQGLG